MEHTKHHFGLIHHVLLGMFLGFGISSIILGIAIMVKERESNVTNNPHRYKRDLQGDIQLTTLPSMSAPEGHIEVITKATQEEIFSEDIMVLDITQEQKEEDIQVLVLTGRNNTYSEDIRKTWGSGFPRLEFVPPTHLVAPYGYNHLLQSLGLACIRHKQTGTPWTVLASDKVYTNPPALRSLLRKLDPAKPLILGTPGSSAPDTCDLPLGSVFSSTSLDRLCPRIHMCEQDLTSGEASEVFGQCIHNTAGLICLEGSIVLGTFRAASPEAVTSSMTVFIGYQGSAYEHYKTHLTMMELHINAVKHSLVHIQYDISDGHTEVTDTKSLDPDPRSKRESVWNDSDDHIPFRSNFLNTSMGPFRQAIVGLDQMYPDACRLNKLDIKDTDGIYKTLTDIVESIVHHESVDVDESLTFGFKLEKPTKGIEYDFYFVDSTETKVQQVSIQQMYEPVEVKAKEISSFTDLNIITAVPDGFESLAAYLEMMHKHCEAYEIMTGKGCSIYLFLNIHFDSNVLKNISQFETIYSCFYFNYIEATNPNPFYSMLRTLKEDLRKDDLLLFLPAESHVNSDLLLRCQLNTKLQERVYFPIGYHSMQQFDDNIEISSYENNFLNDMFWVNKNYDTFCAYNSDIQDFEATVDEPRDVYSLFQWAGFDIHRGPDPSLRFNLGNLCTDFVSSEHDACIEELRYVNKA